MGGQTRQLKASKDAVFAFAADSASESCGTKRGCTNTYFFSESVIASQTQLKKSGMLSGGAKLINGALYMLMKRTKDGAAFASAWWYVQSDTQRGVCTRSESNVEVVSASKRGVWTPPDWNQKWIVPLKERRLSWPIFQIPNKKRIVPLKNMCKCPRNPN